MRWSRHLLLAADPSSATQARAFATDVLHEHDLDDLVDDVELVVNELATNAAMHAGTPFTVTMSSTGSSLLVRVRDRSTEQPVLRDVMTTHPAGGADDRIGGLGLRLVDSISDQWGVESRPRGKTVWATFALD